MIELYTPADVEQAHAAWGASCGPCALAAILSRPIMSLREMFPGFPQQSFVSPMIMLEAVGKAKYHACITVNRLDGKRGRELPRYGLAFIQFSGGWWDDKPAKVQYRKTHWVAVAEPERDDVRVYDANAGEWWTRSEWYAELFPLLLKNNSCAGAWVRTAYEVEAI